MANKTRSVKASANFLSAVFLVHGCFCLFRLAAVLAGADASDVFAPTLFNASPYLDAIIVSILWTCGLIVMFNQRSSAEMAEARDRFRLIFNTSPDAVAVTNLEDGTILDINEGFTALSGYTREDAVGKSSRDVNIWKNPADRETIIAELQQKGFSRNFEAVFLRKDGSQLIGLMSARVIALQGGTHIISVTRDISERKRAEEEKSELLTRLTQAQKLEAIGQLAGGVAHDFNNQLGGIMNYADLLLAKTRDEELCPSIEGIIRLCTRSGELTSKLLAFSRKGRYQVAPVNLHATVAEVVAMLGRSIDKRINIRQRLDANPPTTTGDSTQLQNALLNLGLNARDAMPEGGELVFATDTITLDEAFCGKSRFDLVPGEYLKISVTDSGTGMDEKTRAHLFEPFFTTKEQGKGTGLGLAAVHGTVVSHHGAIQVDSEVGKGTTMTLYLPLSRQETQEATRRGEPAAGTPARARIFIVDDEASLRESTAKLLRLRGYEVVTANDGRDAVEYYRKAWQSLDLVILDMNMPEMNGRDAFIAMRQINPDIKTILATGYSLDSNAQEILDEGVLSYIQKPFRVRELIEHMEQALRG
jgi:PAS domain S-box-containing protein